MTTSGGSSSRLRSRRMNISAKDSGEPISLDGVSGLMPSLQRIRCIDERRNNGYRSLQDPWLQLLDFPEANTSEAGIQKTLWQDWAIFVSEKPSRKVERWKGLNLVSDGYATGFI